MRSFSGGACLNVWVLSLLAICGCTGPRQSATSLVEIRLSGTAGAAVTGYYIRSGQRIELSGTLPMSLGERGISQLAVRKAKAGDRLEVTIRWKDSASSTSSPAGDGDGLRVDVANGIMVSRVGPQESLSPSGNSLMVIAPYWYEGAWVFDDPKTGLNREPFVAGVPEMINALVKDIPAAREGFRLTFSARPFPGFQKRLRWVRSESGGNYYRVADPPMEGWLCPAMFRYFKRAPKELYLKAEPK